MRPEGIRLPERPIEGIKLVVCDMDGTALNDDKEFSNETLRAFGALRERGIDYTIASARTPMMLGVYCAEAHIGSVPLIALEGAVVQRMGVGEPIYELPLPRSYAAELCAATHEMGADYTIYTSSSCYMRRDTHRMWRFELYDRLAATRGERPVPTSVYEDTTPERIAAERVYKIFIDNPNDGLRRRLEALLSAYPEVRTDCSEGSSVSIVHRMASKGEALKRLAEILGLRREEICCFGDWNNDVGMLSSFPNSVAMLNGTEEAKSAAAYVTRSNTANGVAWFIENYILASNNHNFR